MVNPLEHPTAPVQTAAPESAPLGLIQRLVAWCAGNPILTILTVAALTTWGYLALRSVPLDAIPDLSDVQVIIYTEWPGRSPDLVEQQVTLPISNTLLAAPGVKFVRGQSSLGLSFVYVIFEDGTDIYWARSRVLEYLSSTAGRLPPGVQPVLGSDASGVGWVFQYAVVDYTGRHDLAQLRSLQDWNIRYALSSVEGVAEVASVGGFVKQYQVLLEPHKVLAYGIPIPQVIEAIRRSNQDVGAMVFEASGREYMVRGRGYIKDKADIETIPVGLGAGGTPILVRDLGRVVVGPEARRGVAELNGDGEAVGGIVIMRYSQNALTVIEKVKQRLEEVRSSLPEGVEIVVAYDRSDLILRSIATLRTTLIQEMAVVSLVIMVFLLHVRSALVPIVTIPIAVLLAFIPMGWQSLTANIMSLGGIAVAIGAMVDASIVIVENVHKKLETWEEQGRVVPRKVVVISAMQEVAPSIFFALLVITIAFLPVFTLEATEGRLFKPLAYTKTYAMAFSAILAVTLVPALAVLVIRGRVRGEAFNPLNRLLVALYTPVVRWVVRHPWLICSLAAAAMVLTVPTLFRLKSEFMPPLNEGSILYMPTAPSGMSMTEAADILQTMDRKLIKFPEVLSVFGKIGRAETSTDPAPLSMVETVIVLKPESEWRPGMTWEKIKDEMDAALQIPGMPNIWWMPIQTRTEMLSTGLRSALGVKVFGPTTEAVEKAAVDLEKLLQEDPATAPYTRSAFAERVSGGAYLDFTVKREAAARHGLTVSDVEEIIESAIGGMNISQTLEGRERYPIQVRYARGHRENLAALGRVLVPTASGAQIPLSQVAEITFQMGPDMIRTEGGRLVGVVVLDVTGLGAPDYVQRARKVAEEKLVLPPGVRLAWVGQFEHFERAKSKLMIVVPLTLFLVVMLLYFNTKSVVETGMVLLAVPFSLIGAFWLLYHLDYNMSVAVWVGLIALAGLDAETGVVMLLYLKLSHHRWSQEGRLNTFRDLESCIVEGAAKRIRPKLMTVLVDMVGLLPVMLATGAGADVMKRIAAPMVGGIVTSFIGELLVYPALYAIWKRRGLKKE